MSKKLAILGVFVTVGLALGGVAFAVIPSSDGVIHGCAQKFTGFLRVVDESSDCRRFETSLDWNVQGPQGEQGVQGEQGPPGIGLGTREQHVSDSSVAHAHSTRTAVAACPEGSIVVSGGWEELDDVNDLD